MLETKEFYDIMAAFEKDAKKFIRTGAMGLTREPKENWSKQLYYCDGSANDAFRLFLLGVSFGRAYERN